MSIQSKLNLVVIACLFIMSYALFTHSMQHKDLIVFVTPTPTITPIVTPWVKQDILIEIPPGKNSYIYIWSDSPKSDILKIRDIEGVMLATLMNNDRMISAYIDPRYSKQLIGQEIEKQLLVRSSKPK